MFKKQIDTRELMEEKFKLAIVLEYSKMIRNIILLFISHSVPIILFYYLLKREIITINIADIEIYLPIYILLSVISTLVFVKANYIVDLIHVNNNQLIFQKIDKIEFNEILKFKTKYTRGIPSFQFTLKSGKKMSIAATNGFSIKAKNDIFDFIELFEKRFSKENNTSE